MTNREFYAIVANANISEEVTKFAKEAESKLDARNEKRRNTPTKAQEANATLRADMVKFITENGAKVAAEVAAEFAVSTQKASALLGQAVSALTDATHGMTLSAVSLPYYRLIMPYGLKRFVRFAQNVWGVNPEGKNETEIAEEGLKAFEAWMREIGVAMNITELGATEAMLEKLADAALILEGGYKILTRDEILAIFRESL